MIFYEIISQKRDAQTQIEEVNEINILNKQFDNSKLKDNLTQQILPYTPSLKPLLDLRPQGS